jgi:hypothetical protein
LPYTPGIVLFGRILEVDRGAAPGVVNRLKIEVLHVLPPDHHVTKELIQGARAFRAQFTVLPHWGLRQTANQTVLPFREGSTVKALCHLMTEVDPTFRDVVLAKVPELAEYFAGIGISRTSSARSTRTSTSTRAARMSAWPTSTDGYSPDCRTVGFSNHEIGNSTFTFWPWSTTFGRSRFSRSIMSAAMM